MCTLIPVPSLQLYEVRSYVKINHYKQEEIELYTEYTIPQTLSKFSLVVRI